MEYHTGLLIIVRMELDLFIEPLKKENLSEEISIEDERVADAMLLVFSVVSKKCFSQDDYINMTALNKTFYRIRKFFIGKCELSSDMLSAIIRRGKAFSTLPDTRCLGWNEKPRTLCFNGSTISNKLIYPLSAKQGDLLKARKVQKVTSSLVTFQRILEDLSIFRGIRKLFFYSTIVPSLEVFEGCRSLIIHDCEIENFTAPTTLQRLAISYERKFPDSFKKTLSLPNTLRKLSLIIRASGKSYQKLPFPIGFMEALESVKLEKLSVSYFSVDFYSLGISYEKSHFPSLKTLKLENCEVNCFDDKAIQEGFFQRIPKIKLVSGTSVNPGSLLFLTKPVKLTLEAPFSSFVQRKHIKMVENLRVLKLSLTGHEGGVVNIINLTALEILTINSRHQKRVSINVDTLQSLRKMTLINVTPTFDAKTPKVFDSFHEMEELKLDGCLIDFSYALGYFPNLKKLTIGEGYRSLEALKKISMGIPFKSILSGRPYPSITENDALEGYAISGYYLEEKADQDILIPKVIKEMKELETLKISSKNLFSVVGCPKLKTLITKDCLNDIRGCPEIKILVAVNSRLKKFTNDSEEAEEPFTLDNKGVLDKLVHLDVRGSKNLYYISPAPNLRYFNICGTSVRLDNSFLAVFTSPKTLKGEDHKGISILGSFETIVLYFNTFALGQEKAIDAISSLHSQIKELHVRSSKRIAEGCLSDSSSNRKIDALKKTVSRLERIQQENEKSWQNCKKVQRFEFQRFDFEPFESYNLKTSALNSSEEDEETYGTSEEVDSFGSIVEDELEQFDSSDVGDFDPADFE